jgi:recombination protein RecA
MAKAKPKAKAEPNQIHPMVDYPEIEFITSGVKEIDEVTGGYPRGRITELYGKKSVGKTTLMMYMLAKISKDHKVLFMDAENALNKVRLVELGADINHIDFTSTSILEDIGQIILDSLNKYEVIILDSVAGTITKTEAQSEIGDHVVGVKGKVMNSIFSRRLPEVVAKSGCTLLLINQLRDSFNPYGDKVYTPGGKAIEYAASLRIQLNTTKADLITKDGIKIGHKVQVLVTKSKVSRPYAETSFVLKY